MLSEYKETAEEMKEHDVMRVRGGNGDDGEDDSAAEEDVSQFCFAGMKDEERGSRFLRFARSFALPALF